MKYEFADIERRWQESWAKHQTFRAPNPGEPGFDPHQPKYYVLDMFPYPSGVGLHVGHPLGYIATDIVARYKRMKGFNVLHPMGYDAFGLPAEQFAVEQGVHPRITTEQNIANMTRQLKQLGLSYDWDRCLATTDPGYYRWTQWIFLQLFNSWFDPSVNKARPISELIQRLESGHLLIDLDDQPVPAPSNGNLDAIVGTPVGLRKWHELSESERQDVLDDQRLAYIDEAPVNWCPALGTVLANEEVTNDGRSERGNYPVYKRPLRQWMLRITAYAPRLISDLDLVDWPEPIKLMQRNWIGPSAGARVDFPLAYGSTSGPDDIITVFTTRPDTLFGATYMVLAPEHPLVESITTPQQFQAVQQYRQQAATRSDVDRQADAKQKTGVFTGAYALNPVNNENIPVWIADYVMMGYGTGAIMAVPAHDQRDFDFARQFNLPIRAVVKPDAAWFKHAAPESAGNLDAQTLQQLLNLYLCEPAQFNQAFSGEGIGCNSANDEISLNDLPTPQAKQTITAWLEKHGLGKATVQYKLRDWLFSRQRYWGEPFPILHNAQGQPVALPENQLPVELPEMDDFRPAASDNPDQPPQPPLARAPQDWKNPTLNGQTFTREFNTMPQWAGSCWYYLRFLDPHNGERFVGPQAEHYWMTSSKKDGAPHQGGVDLYVGGVEHAVLHLLYARFWHKVLFDLGQVSTPEPFGRLFNQGYIQAFYYEDQRGMRVPADEIQEKEGKFFYQGQEVKRFLGKMGKSLKNAIAPDDICAQYGCDTLRLYEMYLGPLDQSKIWRTGDILGVHRFLQRLWRLLIDENDGHLRVGDQPAPDDLRRLLHKTIKRVTDAMDSMSFNVAIAALIELNNDLVKRSGSDETGTTGSTPQKWTTPREVAQAMALLLSPLAPHIAEELWSKLGHTQSLARYPWPSYDPALLIEDQIEYPVQINGKLRSRLTVPADADAKTVEQAALADEKVQALIADKTVRKVIIIPKRTINIVVG